MFANTIMIFPTRRMIGQPERHASAYSIDGTQIKNIEAVQFELPDYKCETMCQVKGQSEFPLLPNQETCRKLMKENNATNMNATITITYKEQGKLCIKSTLVPYTLWK